MSVSRQEIIREDVRQLNKKYYSLKDKEISFYDIPEMKYLITSGTGTHSIYKMYDFKEIWTIGRFINRVKHYTVKDLKKNFSRMPLEMQWEKGTDSEISFKAMMWVPYYITKEIYINTMNDLKERLGPFDFKIDLALVPKRRCAQLLHEGHYQDINATKQKLFDVLFKQGYKLNGISQEIYMNHPHCNPPEKLKILLRQEIEK